MYRYKLKQNRNTRVHIRRHMSYPTPSPQMLCQTLSNYLLCKSRLGLSIYKSNELFIETMNPRKSNIIVSSIYKHPSVDLTNFNINCLNNPLDKVSKEQKTIFALDDFNVNLLNYDNHNPTNELLDSLASNSFIHYFSQPLAYLVILEYL